MFKILFTIQFIEFYARFQNMKNTQAYQINNICFSLIRNKVKYNYLFIQFLPVEKDVRKHKQYVTILQG